MLWVSAARTHGDYSTRAFTLPVGPHLASLDVPFANINTAKFQEPWAETDAAAWVYRRWENVDLQGRWRSAKNLQPALLHRMALIKISVLRKRMVRKTSVQHAGEISLVFNSSIPGLVENTANSPGGYLLIRLLEVIQRWITDRSFPSK